MDCPGSGKSTLAESLAKKLDGVWLNADPRKKYNDWDFVLLKVYATSITNEASFQKELSMAGKVAVVDFICPTKEARQLFEPDYTVWMDTIRSAGTMIQTKYLKSPRLIQ